MTIKTIQKSHVHLVSQNYDQAYVCTVSAIIVHLKESVLLYGFA